MDGDRSRRWRRTETSRRSARRNAAAIVFVAALSTVVAGTASIADASVVEAAQHIVLPGETVTSIAASYGLDAAALAELNGISVETPLRPGRRLELPAGTDVDVFHVTPTTVVRATSTSATGGNSSTTASTAASSTRVVSTTSVAVEASGSRPTGSTGVAGSTGVTGSTGGVSSTTTSTTMTSSTISGPKSTTLPAPPIADTPPTFVPDFVKADRRALGAVFTRYGSQYGVPADLVMATAYVESGWRATAESPVGAMGVMQLMPGTVRFVSRDLLGLSHDLDAWSPDDNIRMGVRFMAYLLQQTGGNVDEALWGYNQGLRSVRANGPFPSVRQFAITIQSLRPRFAPLSTR